MNIQIHLQIGSLAQLNRASDYGSEGYRFESYASHLRILISSSVFGSNEIRIFSISTGRIIIIHIFAVNTAQRKIPVVLHFLHHRHKAGGASPLA